MIAALLAGLVGCGSSPESTTPPPSAEDPTAAAAAPDAPQRRLDVRALSFPAGWLAATIGAERVAVTTIAPEGEDPPTWRPPPELVVRLADADLVVASGAGYEAWTATAALPVRTFVSLADKLDLITLAGKVHKHGAAGEHTHEGRDPHVWTDPLLWVQAAGPLREALVTADPAGAPTYDAAVERLRAEAARIDAALAEAAKPLAGRKLAANHPSFHYLARRYGLDVRVIDIDPEAVPDASVTAEVVRWVAEAGPRPTLLWENPPTGRVVAALPKGIDHVLLDPLEQPRGGAYDWIRQSTVNVAELRRIAAAEP